MVRSLRRAPVVSPAPPGDQAVPAVTRPRLLAAFAAVYILWGSTYLAIVYAIADIPPLWMAAMRFLLAGSIMVGWGRLRGAPWPPWRDVLSAAGVGLLMMSFGNGALSQAETKMPIGIAAVLIATVPMWMVAVEAVLVRRRPALGVLAGIVVGLVGVGLLAGVEDGWKDGAIDPWLVAGVLGGSLAWAVGSLWSRTSRIASMRMRAGTQMLAGGLFLALGGAVFQPFPDLAGVTWTAWAALAYLVVAGSVVAFTAYVWLLRTVSAAAVGTYAFVNPVVALVLGILVLDEPLTLRSGLASALILVAVLIINRTQARATLRR